MGLVFRKKILKNTMDRNSKNMKKREKKPIFLTFPTVFILSMKDEIVIQKNLFMKIIVYFGSEFIGSLILPVL